MNIEDCIQVFIHTCNKFEWNRISRQLVSLKENCDKIKFVLDVLEKKNFLGDSDYLLFDGKSNEKSVEYRTQGNTYFQLRHKNYPRALEFYNKSICYAESNTECLAIGYANRSAIYYEWKMFTKCLENIELAFKSCANMPDKLREKLLNRKKLCLNNITMGNETDERIDESDPVKLTYPAHPTVPFVADCVVRDRNEFGQYIKTTRDLLPGDCIAVERPLFAMLETQQIYKRCAHCMADNTFSLIPCPNCTATMYCSETCLTTAYTESHRFECSAINALITLFSTDNLTALGVVLKLFSNDNYLNKTFAYLNDFRPMTVYDMDYNSPFDYADEYKLLHINGKNESSFDTHELFSIAARAAILYKLVKTNKYLEEIFLKRTVGRNYENLFLNLLFHKLIPGNLVLFRFGALDIPLWSASVYGWAIYPFIPLLNHSCAPNVVKILHGSLCNPVLFVSRKVACGEQLFFNKGSNHYLIMSRQVRQKKLDQDWNLKCICDACQFDYPMYSNLKMHPSLPHIVMNKVKMELSACNRPYARALLGIVVEYLIKYDKFYPTLQVVDVEKALIICLQILLN